MGGGRELCGPGSGKKSEYRRDLAGVNTLTFKSFNLRWGIGLVREQCYLGCVMD